MARKKKKTKATRNAKPTKTQPTAIVEGDVWAIPVPKMGFCPVIVTRGVSPMAGVDFVFAYVYPSLTESLPVPSAIPPIGKWKQAWFGLVSSRPFARGRWPHCGPLPKFNRHDWPVPPTRSASASDIDSNDEGGDSPESVLRSIETTPNEPTMTLIANDPATREDASHFPGIDIVTAASALENALATHFKNRTGSFLDMQICLEDVSPSRMRHWREYADAVRSRPSQLPTDWLPAGRKTDRQLKPGAWMGFPRGGGGFGAALLVAKPEAHERFFADAVVFAMRPSWDRWPTLKDVLQLEPEQGALVAPTTMICVRDGRWRVLGYDDDFDAERWTWPRPWYQLPEQRGTSEIKLNTAEGPIVVDIDPAVLKLDPHAGNRCGFGCYSYSAIEFDVTRIVQGTHWSMRPSYDPNARGASHAGIVTPGQLQAWRRINAAIQAALEKR